MVWLPGQAASEMHNDELSAAELGPQNSWKGKLVKDLSHFQRLKKKYADVPACPGIAEEMRKGMSFTLSYSLKRTSTSRFVSPLCTNCGDTAHSGHAVQA